MKIVLGSMDNFNQQGLPEPTWGTAQANPANPAGTAVNDNVEQSTIRNDEQSTHRNVEPTGNSGEAFSEAGTGASTPSSIVLEPSRKISTASAVSSNEHEILADLFQERPSLAGELLALLGALSQEHASPELLADPVELPT